MEICLKDYINLNKSLKNYHHF